MELGLGVVVPATGARADVLVRARTGARLGEVAPLLLARVQPEAGAGSLSVDGTPVAPDALIGSPPLVEGAVLQVDSAAAAPVLPGLPELRVVGGPDAGAVHRLAPGTVTVGRDPSCAIRLDDPDVSRAHCRLTVGHPGVRVADLGSTNGTTVDGDPVTDGAELTPGAVLRVGATRLVLVAGDAPSAPVSPSGDGRLAFNRQPRLRPPHDVVQVVVPAPPAERERSPLPVLAVIAPVVLGVVMWQVTGSTTFLLFTLLTPLLVLGNVVSERRSGRRRGRRETALWTAQREVAEKTLAAAVRTDEQERRAAAPDPAEVLLSALGPRPRLWERRRSDDDLLELRIGLADLPARVEAEGDVREGATTARDVPVVVPLREAGVLGVAGERAPCLARWLVAQAAVWHSPRDLQLVVLAEPAAAERWEWTRWLPHTRADGGQDCRALLGFGHAQVAARVGELRSLVEARRADRPSGDLRRVLVVIDGARALRAVPGLAELLAEGPAAGVHAVCVEADPRLLPEECGATAVLAAGTVDVQVTGRAEIRGVTADLVGTAWADRVARALAPLRDSTRDRDGSDGLPSSVRWTDVVGLPLEGGDVDVARVLDRWASPGRSTTAALGRGPDGVFSVDLTRDGPHALVAGTTGSGKSELLQTLIASLALTNRPDELTFVLVDYKGGAAFGPCARLPHTVGMVTDLDGSLVERALASLHAELARREAVLAEVGAKDIDDHRRRWGTPGGPREVLPRLVLVVDEFASLVEDLPDFVGGLVGIAMRGRSLGVHLVLATQRPEGVVSADIRANTNLRLCLAVTRDAESRDVLDSPAAAAIPRTAPGRAFARTGHADLTPFQTGRVGGRRPAAVAEDSSPRVELLPAADLGDPLPRPQGQQQPDEVTDLSLLVDACVAAAGRLGLGPQRSPWLPPLPDGVQVGDLPPVEDPLADVPGRVAPLPYALLDVPGRQARRTLALDLDRMTHLVVLGSARSGRTTALRTLAGSLAAASPDDVHLYGLDPGGGGLAPLRALPHTGAVVSSEQPQRVERLLTRLAEEVARRQSRLAAGGHADLSEQRAAAPPEDRLPHLLLMVDRWEAFLAAFAEIDGGRLVDLVLRLLREGPGVGLHVVVTADRSGLVGRISSLVPDTLLLRMADRADYAGAGLPTRLVPGALPAGRGWQLGAEPHVAQVALLPGAATGPAQTAALADLAAAAPRPRLHRPFRVEPLPAVVSRAELPATSGRSVPLGLGGDELDPVVVDLDAAFLIGGPAGAGRSSALLLVADALRSTGVRVVPVAPRPSPLRALPGCVTSRDAAAELEALMADGDCAVLVDDAELLVDSGLAHVLETAVRDARDRRTTVVAAGSTDELVTGYRGFVVDLRKARTGMLLSPQAVGDGDLLGIRLSRSTGGPVHPGRGLLVRAGRVEPVQLAGPT